MSPPLYVQECRLGEESLLVPEQLRVQRSQDAVSGNWWNFIFWGHNLIRVLPSGAPAESAVTVNFGVDLELIRMPKLLPLKVSGHLWYWQQVLWTYMVRVNTF